MRHQANVLFAGFVAEAGALLLHVAVGAAFSPAAIACCVIIADYQHMRGMDFRPRVVLVDMGNSVGLVRHDLEITGLGVDAVELVLEKSFEV